ncbi:UNVERIFIED_CONTAM: hypothetical protein FKN15_063771 [Acipenser sinensis]
MDLMFKSQKQCVKNSIECKWHLAEAQQKLCSLELHNSESLEQEHAKAQADSSELRQTEQEWRHKEKMLRWGERQNPVLSNAFSREVFNKAGEEGYLEAFTTELEAFKWRVKQYPLNRSGEISEEMQRLKSLNHCSVEPTEVMESLAPDLKRGFQLQDRQVLQNVQSNMNPQVSEYYVKCCIDAGLWVVPSKEDTDETRMMETS